MHHPRLRGAALVAAAATVLIVGAGGTAAADPASTGGYQYASNYDNGAVWQVGDAPIRQAVATQRIIAAGIRLVTRPPSGEYADSGVIVPVGTVGDLFDEGGAFVGVPLTGQHLSDTATNLYVDANGDGQYLAFSYNGRYENDGGDQILFNVGNATTRSEVETTDDSTKVWAWVGVSGNAPRTATVASVNGHPLVHDVFRPSVMTVANLCRVSRGASPNLWLVRNNNVRDRTFHLGVEYQGRTRWTGVHHIARGGSAGVVTPNGGRAILQYYDGSGAAHFVDPAPTAVSDHTVYCG